MKPDYLGIALWLLSLVSLAGMVVALIVSNVPVLVFFAAFYVAATPQLAEHIRGNLK